MKTTTVTNSSRISCPFHTTVTSAFVGPLSQQAPLQSALDTDKVCLQWFHHWSSAGACQRVHELRVSVFFWCRSSRCSSTDCFDSDDEDTFVTVRKEISVTTLCSHPLAYLFSRMLDLFFIDLLHCLENGGDHVSARMRSGHQSPFNQRCLSLHRDQLN